MTGPTARGPLIDLHAHTNRSDGTDSPADLIRHAVDRGIDVVAITDHDTFDGWDDALAAAEQYGVGLIRGAEVSCIFRGTGVHMLIYLPDPTYPPLVEELARVGGGREDRLPRLLHRLAELGLELTENEVRSAAGPAVSIGRPHVADALVARGYVASREEAFDEYLAEGKPGYVRRHAADPANLISLVRAAGGVSCVAHPWRKQARMVLTATELAGLATAGLTAIEVDHEDHDEATRRELREVARELDLIVTGSSDYHGLGKADHELGCNTTAPSEFERLLDAAQRSRTASRRPAPLPFFPAPVLPVNPDESS